MAHFAQLDENNKVINVALISNNDILDENGQESENVGIAFCKSLFGEDTKWVQTSYNATFRKKYAGIGDTYNSERDGFIPPKLHNSDIFDEESWTWTYPVDHPADGKHYQWDEDTISWKEFLPE